MSDIIQRVDFEITTPSIRNTGGMKPLDQLEWVGGASISIILNNINNAKRILVKYTTDDGLTWTDMVTVTITSSSPPAGDDWYINTTAPINWSNNNLILRAEIVETYDGTPVQGGVYYDTTWPIRVIDPDMLQVDGAITLPIPSRCDTGQYVVFDRSAALASGSVLYLDDGGYITNEGNTSPIGAVHETSILTLPSDYADDDKVWFIDWSIIEKNDARLKRYVRTYPIINIPESVPYIEVTSNRIEPMQVQADSGSLSSHYTFDNGSKLVDVGANSVDLSLLGGSTSEKVDSRHEQHFGLKPTTSIAFQGTYAGTALNFFLRGAFSISAWLTGIDSNALSGGFSYKVQTTSSSTIGLDGAGVAFVIDNAAQTMKLQVNNGALVEVSHDISYLYDEYPSRYHFMNAVYNNGTVLLFIDGKKVYREDIAGGLPNQVSGYATLSMNGNIGIDELLIDLNPMVDAQHLALYEKSRPRMNRNYFYPWEVQRFNQSQLIFIASGANELEYHQFSMFGVEDDSKLLPIAEAPPLAASVLMTSTGGSILDGSHNATWIIRITIGDPTEATSGVKKIIAAVIVEQDASGLWEDFEVTAVTPGAFMCDGACVQGGYTSPGRAQVTIESDVSPLSTGSGIAFDVTFKNSVSVVGESIVVKLIGVSLYDISDDVIPIVVEVESIPITFTVL